MGGWAHQRTASRHAPEGLARHTSTLPVLCLTCSNRAGLRALQHEYVEALVDAKAAIQNVSGVCSCSRVSAMVFRSRCRAVNSCTPRAVCPSLGCLTLTLRAGPQLAEALASQGHSAPWSGPASCGAAGVHRGARAQYTAPRSPLFHDVQCSLQHALLASHAKARTCVRVCVQVVDRGIAACSDQAWALESVKAGMCHHTYTHTHTRIHANTCTPCHLSAPLYIRALARYQYDSS